MIQIGNVGSNAQYCTQSTHCCGFGKVRHTLLPDGIHEETYYKEEDDKEVIVGHLHVIGIDFEGREYARNYQSCKVFSSISQ